MENTSKVIVDNIKEFPKDISIDIASVYQQFGKEAPTLGEIVYFTTNAVLKDGYTVYGWTEYSDFNNKLFTGWEVDGRAYSYNVRYPVACQLVLEEFVGPVVLMIFMMSIGQKSLKHRIRNWRYMESLKVKILMAS